MTQNGAQPTTLFEKFLDAQSKAQAVGKQGHNQKQNYKYARAEDVIAEAQRALHEAGLVGWMAHGEVTSHEVTSQGGSAGLFVSLASTLVVVDPSDPAHRVEIPAHGTGVDYPGDKAVYKAMTGAAKYAYASALGIPFGDDPEEETGGSGQERAPRNDVASPAQKRAITTILNKAGIEREFQRQIVHAVAGDPPTKRGASEILDLIAGDTADDPKALANAVETLIARSGVIPPSDIPADVPPEPVAVADDEVPFS